MSSRALSKSILALLLIHSVSGCSWVFMNKAPEPVAAPNLPVDCTSSNAAPILDSICGGYFVASALVIATLASCYRTSPDQPCAQADGAYAGVAVAAGLAALCTASAVSGFKAVRQCNGVRASNTLCITGDEAACRRLNPAWTPPLRLPAAPSGGAAPAPAPATGPADKVNTPVPVEAGCAKDVDCKGDRICERGLCVAPPGKATPPGQVTPAPGQ